MTLKVEGDFKQLEQWKKLFTEGDKALDLTSRAMAEELLQLTFERFRAETDPYGKRWKAKKRSDGRKVLSGKTSRLKDGWHIVRADRHGWLIAPSVDYALPHQTGSLKGRGKKKRLARRAMVPYKGLPRAYRIALEESAQDALLVVFTGSGARIPSGLTRRFSIRTLVRRVVKQTVGAAANG